MKLSARRAKFVEEYCLNPNGSAAARAAGYAESGARITAHRLLTNANVIAAIDQKKQELAQQYELSRDSVVRELMATIEIAREQLDPSSMIRAWVEIAKIMGFYAPKVIKEVLVTENAPMRAKYEAMSDDELLAIVEKVY